MGGAGDRPDPWVVEKMENLGDVVDAHVEERAAGRDLLLHEGAGPIAVHVGRPRLRKPIDFA